MTPKEIISLTLEFDSEYAVNPPVIDILHNNQTVLNDVSIIAKQKIDIDLELDANQNCVLEINRKAHDNTHHQICKFLSLSVDGIDISSVLNYGLFYPEYPEPWFTEQLSMGTHWPQSHCGWREWGWNGAWRLEYSTPFYTWLLKMV